MKADSPNKNRNRWLKTLHQWHWMSSALSLIGLLLFAATGITLNNAAWLEARPVVINRSATLPADVLAEIERLDPARKTTRLPVTAEKWLDSQLGIHIGARPAELSADEIYLSLPEPGADAWLSIDRTSGSVQYEHSRRGWIAYLNDLHKGRHTGLAWNWFIDLFAVACIIFAMTGLFLLKLHSRHRLSTWPLVGLGLVGPAVLLMIFSH